MENPDSDSRSAKLRLLLLVALALLSAWAAWSAYRLSSENLAQQNSWKHYEGEIRDSRSPVWAEVVIDEALARSLPTLRRPESNASSHGKVNVLLPNRRWASYGHFNAVQLAQDPARPERLLILDETAMWLPVAGSLLLLAVAALGLGWLYLTPWERDRTWSNGAWRDSEPMAPKAGAGSPLAEPLTEPKGNQVFAALLGILLFLPFSLWMLTGLNAYPFEAGVQLAVALPLLALSLRSVVKVHTRRVRFDAAGLADADFFGVRRVPWSAIKDIRLINLNEQSQEMYDQTKFEDREGRRPDDNLGAWDVKAERGVVLLRLYKSMLPQGALPALLQRIQRQVRESAQGAFGLTGDVPAPRQVTSGMSALAASEAAVHRALGKEPPHAVLADPGDHDMDGRMTGMRILQEGERVLDPNNPADRKLIEEHDKAMSQIHKDWSQRDLVRAKLKKSRKGAERRVLVFMVLVVSGMVSGTGYLAFQSMWDEATFLGGLSLFVGLLTWAIWWAAMRFGRPR